MKCMGDFKGITYTEGDYHTQGQSGFGALDFSSFITPELKQSVISAAKNGAIEGVKYVWQEYKAPIILVGTALALTFLFENIANAKILGQRK